jgi:hypothetical protein
MAPMPYLADWIQAHRSRVGELAGVQSGSDGWKEEMARKLQTAIRQRLPQKVAAEAERITALKGQLKHLKAKEEVFMHVRVLYSRKGHFGPSLV